MEWMHCITFSGELPDVIICDVEMPVMNGFEFIRRIRESGFFDEIPLMMLSGRRRAPIKSNVLKWGLMIILLSLSIQGS